MRFVRIKPTLTATAPAVILTSTLSLLPAITGGPAGAFEIDTSSFLGGRGYDRAQYVTIDKKGAIYIAGNTRSGDFPVTAGAFDATHNGDQDAFVAKFSPDARNLIWATYLGGSQRDQAYGLRVTRSGDVLVVGATGSSNFPTTPGAYDRRFNGGSQGSGGYGDVFVARLSANGSDLIFSTFVGGSGGGEENPRGAIHLDSSENVYVAGYTQASDFPTTSGAFQTRPGGGVGDGFVFKLSADGSRLLHSTYLGGSGDDWILEDIAALPDGSLVVAGGTASADFPTTPGAFQTQFRGPGGARWWDGDGFVTSLSADLSRVGFSTFVGGSDNDLLGSVAIARGGQIVLTGGTKSVDIPTSTGAYDTRHAGGWDGFVAILSSDGASLAHATYLGGSGLEELTRGKVDDTGRVFITGNTDSQDWPVTGGAAQTTYRGGRSDGVLAVLSPDLGSLLYSTFVGGSGEDRGRGLWIRSNNSLMIVGDTKSSNFPTTSNAYDPRHNGDNDGFLVKLEAGTSKTADLAKPKRLRARVLSKRKVKLRWKHSPSPIDSYEVQMKAIPGPRYEVVARVSATVRKVVIAGLTPAGVYRFRVRARQGESVSRFSNRVTVTLPET